MRPSGGAAINALDHALFRSSKADANGGPWLHKVAAGGGLALVPPPGRKRPPELEERLAQLRQRLEEKQYADMVADVTVEVSLCQKWVVILCMMKTAARWT